MTKQEFLRLLTERLSCLPEEELNERICFYAEMLDDKIEDGISEEEAVAQIGSPADIAGQIIAETPLSSLVKKKIKGSRKIGWWELVLIILGSPIWLSLLISALAVVLSLYVSLWAVVISLWAVFASLAACGVAGILAGVGFTIGGNIPSGLLLISGGLVCGGLAIFTFFGCKYATLGTVWLEKAFFLWIKKLFMKKEEA